MKPKMMLRLGALGAATLLISGCVNPFVVACKQVAKDGKEEFKYTEEQASVACAEAQKYAFPELFKQEKEEGSDKVTWELNPHGLSAKDVEEVMQNQARDIDVFLSYENRDFADTIDWLRGLREGLEKQELITKSILNDLAIVRMFNEFSGEVVQPPKEKTKKSDSFQYFFPSDTKAFSMRLLYPHAEHSLRNVPFAASYVEAAKKEGTLKLVDTFSYTTLQEYGEKVQDLYEANKFSWKPRERGWKVYAYKIMPEADANPETNTVHYIEIYRLNDDLKTPEEKPAVRGFLPSGGSEVTVFLIDYENEGEQGYGIPNKLWKTYSGIKTAREIMENSSTRTMLLEELYDKPKNVDTKRPDRVRPTDPAVYVSIVEAGGVEVDLWEGGTFTVPFDYDDLSTSFKLSYVPFDPSEEDESLKNLKKIKGFSRAFQRDGNNVAVEHWTPKEEYAERNVSEAYAYSGTIKVRRKGDIYREGELAYFADRLTGIDYLFGGKWFRIVDEDGDGVFEKKREIAYNDSGSSSYSSMDDERYR